MSYRSTSKKVARILISGPDRKGIIAGVTGYLFKSGCNIEDIDQRILEGFLIMNMLVDYTDLKVPVPRFISGLKEVAKSIRTQAEFKPQDVARVKRVAVLVTREPHCLKQLIKDFKKWKSRARIVVVIGNAPDLKSTSLKAKIPFFYVPSIKKKEHEEGMLNILKKFDVDLIVLARYMQILSPEFVFRYEGRVINIHPSLLPAFPGPRSYHQAYNKGVEIVGVTAHFTTTDLDEGPIIAQDAFRVDTNRATVEDYIAQGRNREAKVLSRAVRLFIEDRLSLRRGKVIDSKKIHSLTEKAHQFYH